MRVRMNLKQCAWIVAMALGTGITGSTARARCISVTPGAGTTRIIRKIKTTSRVRVTVRMTKRITGTTPRRGTSRRTTTRRLTRPATSRVTKTIHQIINSKPGQKQSLGVRIQFIGRGGRRRAQTRQSSPLVGPHRVTVWLCHHKRYPAAHGKHTISRKLIATRGSPPRVRLAWSVEFRKIVVFYWRSWATFQ